MSGERDNAALLNRAEDLRLLIAIAKDDRFSSEAVGIRFRNNLAFWEQLCALVSRPLHSVQKEQS
jgi:hypothetical protein